MRRLNQIMDVILGSFLGIFVGHSIYECWNYYAHPDWYARQSAPWYSSILLYGAFTCAVLLIVLVCKWLIRRKRKAHGHKHG